MENPELSRTMMEIYHYMRRYGGITQADAFLDLGCARLGARIYDMKSRGIPIRSVMTEVRKKNGQSAYVAMYKIEEGYRHPVYDKEV